MIIRSNLQKTLVFGWNCPSGILILNVMSKDSLQGCFLPWADNLHEALINARPFPPQSSELDYFRTNGGEPPQYGFTLCFGEELSDSEDPYQKLIIVQVNHTHSAVCFFCGGDFPGNFR